MISTSGHVSIEHIGTKSISLRLRGTLDAATAAEVAGHIDPLRASGAHLRIDLTGVTFIDTEGARALIGAADDAQRRGDFLEITGWSSASAHLRNALQILSDLDRG